MGLAEISRFDHPVLHNYLVDGAYDETFETPGQTPPALRPIAGDVFLPTGRRDSAAKAIPPTFHS